MTVVMYCCITALSDFAVQGKVGLWIHCGVWFTEAVPARRLCSRSVWWYAWARATNWSPSQKLKVYGSFSSADHHIWLEEAMRLNWLPEVICSSTSASVIWSAVSAAPMYSPGCDTAAAPRSVPVPVVVGSAATSAGHDTIVGAGSGAAGVPPENVQVSPSSPPAASAPPNSTTLPLGPAAAAGARRADGCPLGVTWLQPLPSHDQVSCRYPLLPAPPNRIGDSPSWLRSARLLSAS